MRKVAGILILIVGLSAGMPAALGEPAAGSGEARQGEFLGGSVKVTLDRETRVEWTSERRARAVPIRFSPRSSRPVMARPQIRSLADLRNQPAAVVLPGTRASESALDRYLAAGRGLVDF